MFMDSDAVIRTRAYAIWEAEGRPDGRSLEHWLQAEAEAAPSPMPPGVRRPKAARAAAPGKAPAKKAAPRKAATKAAAPREASKTSASRPSPARA